MPDANRTSPPLTQPGESDRMRHTRYTALRDAGIEDWLAFVLWANGYGVLPLSALEAK